MSDKVRVTSRFWTLCCGFTFLMFGVLGLGGMLEAGPSGLAESWPGVLAVTVLCLLSYRGFTQRVTVKGDTVVVREILRSRSIERAGIRKVYACPYSGQVNWYAASRMLTMVCIELDDGRILSIRALTGIARPPRKAVVDRLANAVGRYDSS